MDKVVSSRTFRIVEHDRLIAHREDDDDAEGNNLGRIDRRFDALSDASDIEDGLQIADEESDEISADEEDDFEFENIDVSDVYVSKDETFMAKGFHLSTEIEGVQHNISAFWSFD
ncbi:hypothetical protein PR048_027589 [Dryococelus australis]|uniref:Uncharacterized protein n=1 Tax=Dryococelus australis TaxID=614101 RepID=A0ABQ9GGY5_9NEOP|nr:hypothetical protein PR048_027589 [Dryococelus australis]